MCKRLVYCVGVVLGVFGGSFFSTFQPAQGAENELQLTTERVIVFKDGYFLVIKRGVATADAQGHVYTDDVPDSAALGTFWATHEDGKLNGMIAGWTETETKEEFQAHCRSTLEILVANEGQDVVITTNDNQTSTGKLLKVLAENVYAPIDALPPSLALHSSHLPHKVKQTNRSASPAAITSTISDLQGSQFILRTTEGDILFQVGNVKTLSIKEMKSTTIRTFHTKKKTKRLTFLTNAPQRQQTIHLYYFRPGIRWIPTYRVNLNSKAATKTARVALQAEILNEAEDLNGVPVDIVVGVPNFRFRDTISPLTLETAMRNALRDAAPQLMGQASNGFGNASYAQRSGEFRREAALAGGTGLEGGVEIPGELQASASQDLFVYKLPKINLAVGERTTVPIFEATCPYRDVYTWEVRVNRQSIEAAPSGSGVASPLTLAKNDVWRQVELTNSTNLPWTTGAVMLMEGDQPLAQELLTYTSPKNPCRVPLTVAVEVKGAFEEKETGRDLNALDWRGHHYAKIIKQAKLHVCNNKNIPIDLEISLRLGGRVNMASDDGQVTLHPFRNEDWTHYSGDPAVNNSSQVEWKISLKPGEILEPEVNYHYFAYH